MIYENDDALGYYATPPDSLHICNSMLPKRERDKIVKAAIRAHERKPLDYNDTTS